jgi:serine/threonine-protein kinase HipA
MSQVLDVYLSTEQVGRLYLDDERRFVFEYHPDWIEDYESLPLSLSLPVRAEPFHDAYAQPFFANLLPEAEIRHLIAKNLGVSEKNDFALLEAIGGECAGAVSLFPEGTKLPATSDYKKLNDDALNKLVADLPVQPMMAGEQGIRLSLAGAQNKLPVFYVGNEIKIPRGIAASSHILKPPMLHYPNTVENEYFCMQLAEKVGLNVPGTQILHKAVALYLITRYDRVYNDYGDLIRLHQEDFCQAMAIPPSNKYEKEGGPSMRACFELVRNHSIQPTKDLNELLNWVIFNFLIGNADAHGKNISLMLTPVGPKLAPFYDLMSTAVYPNLAQKMAMKIGGEDRPDWIIERRWEQFAEDTGIKFKLIKKRCLDISSTLSSVAVEFAPEYQKQHGENNQIKKIVELIGQRKRKLNSIFNSANS